MTMFMNIDKIPAGKSLYTVYVTTQDEDVTREECEADEVDVIASSSISAENWGSVCNEGRVLGQPDDDHKPATNWMLEMYGLDTIVVGIVNQSDAFILFDMWHAKEQGLL